MLLVGDCEDLDTSASVRINPLSHPIPYDTFARCHIDANVDPEWLFDIQWAFGGSSQIASRPPHYLTSDSVDNTPLLEFDAPSPRTNETPQAMSPRHLSP